ncbi:hypothetical protein B9Z55_012019 [Caenorhabditis nigoni]|nr:hypothetical protein B9Z55_012019 [Caenorhabditis nigoni]
MRLFVFIAAFLIFVTYGQEQMQINHRGRFFLRNVNEARKILASGLIRQLEPLGLGFITLPPVGPAANMYRMKWSVPMETVANKSLLEISKRKDLCGNYKTSEYSGFYWKYDLVDAVNDVGKRIFGAKFDPILEKLKSFSSAIETLIFLVWAILTYPKSFPIPENAEIGPSEALYAHRYEMGCAFDDVALCILRDTTANGTLYKEGVACTKCPTYCEFVEQADGTIDEGDLCVPPKPGSAEDAGMKLSAEMKEFEDSSSSPVDIIITILVSLTIIFNTVI